MTGTRRQLLAGAAATALAPVAAGSAAAAPPDVRAERVTVRRGRAIAATPHGGRLVVAHAGRRTIAVLDRRRGATRIVDVGGEPLDVAVSPDGRRAAVVTASWAEPALVLVDLASAAVTGRLDAGPAPGAVAFAGERIVVAGGEQEGTVHLFEGDRVASFPAGRVPRGIATAADDAWVALNAEAAVVRVDLRTGELAERIEVAPQPGRLALSPDGTRLLVTHRDAVTEIASGGTRRHDPGRLPSDVGFTRSGRPLVALGGEGAVAVLGGGRHAVGPEPRGLAVAGERAWTVSGVTGEVREVGR